MKLTTRYQAVLGDKRGPAFDCELVCRHSVPLHCGWIVETVQLLEFETFDMAEGTDLHCLVAFDGRAPRIVLVHSGDWRSLEIEITSALASDICMQAILIREKIRHSLWNRFIALIS